MYACNQRSDVITSFRINQESGRLSSTGKYHGIGSPACIVFCA
jgi:6-phosphogluconolactonase (cycloisomerase 2 family)